MSFSPPTLAAPRLVPFDHAAWTATAVVNPVLALIATRPHLGLLLAKDAQEQPDRTLLRAVHWVRVPQGWRLALVRAWARLRPVRLPDEWLFNEVALERRGGGETVAANVAPEYPGGLYLPAAGPFRVKPLTHRQYHTLCDASGRLLLAQASATFNLPADPAPRPARRTLPGPAFSA